MQTIKKLLRNLNKHVQNQKITLTSYYRENIFLTKGAIIDIGIYVVLFKFDVIISKKLHSFYWLVMMSLEKIHKLLWLVMIGNVLVTSKLRKVSLRPRLPNSLNLNANEVLQYQKIWMIDDSIVWNKSSLMKFFYFSG